MILVQDSAVELAQDKLLQKTLMWKLVGNRNYSRLHTAFISWEATAELVIYRAASLSASCNEGAHYPSVDEKNEVKIW